MGYNYERRNLSEHIAYVIGVENRSAKRAFHISLPEMDKLYALTYSRYCGATDYKTTGTVSPTWLILTLYYDYKRPYKEIADLLGMTVASVTRIVHKFNWELYFIDGRELSSDPRAIRLSNYIAELRQKYESDPKEGDK